MSKFVDESGNLSGEKKRQTLRLKLKLPVAFVVIDQKGQPLSDDVFEGYTQDISEGGMLYQGAMPEKGMRQRLVNRELFLGLNIFFLSSKDKIKLIAEVRWLEEKKKEGSVDFSVGLKFRGLDEASRKKLARLVESVQYSGSFTA